MSSELCKSSQISSSGMKCNCYQYKKIQINRLVLGFRLNLIVHNYNTKNNVAMTRICSWGTVTTDKT